MFINLNSISTVGSKIKNSSIITQIFKNTINIDTQYNLI